MDIEQLKYFQAITEHKTFLEAADEMSISQSSLSRHLIKLESELGVNLIDRSKRSASLTEAGKIFAKDVEILLAQYKTMLSNIQPFKNNNNTKNENLTVTVKKSTKKTKKIRETRNQSPPRMSEIGENSQENDEEYTSERKMNKMMKMIKNAHIEKIKNFIYLKESLTIHS